MLRKSLITRQPDQHGGQDRWQSWAEHLEAHRLGVQLQKKTYVLVYVGNDTLYILSRALPIIRTEHQARNPREIFRELLLYI